MSVSATFLEGPVGSPSLPERILAIVSRRGCAGITRDELLRKLGVAYDDLMAALGELEARDLVRVHWPAVDTFRVFFTG